MAASCWCAEVKPHHPQKCRGKSWESWLCRVTQIPGRGDASGIDNVPAPMACPNEELERTPPSLCLPTSPMSTKIDLKEETRGTIVYSNVVVWLL